MDNFSHLNSVTRENTGLSTSSVAVLNTDFEPNFNQLVERLQTSLDISRLLQIFADEVAKYVDISGISFQCIYDVFTTPHTNTGAYQHNEEIIAANEQLGLLTFATQHVPDEKELNLLQRLAEKLAYPLKHALVFIELKNQALNDQLTGLGNRSFFEDRYSRAVTNASNQQDELTLLLVDLDNFKQVNDNWGHSEGDQILKEFARILQSSIRKTDMAFRFGGDEFAVILEGANEMAAHRVATTVKKNTNLNTYLSRLGVSASIGYAKLESAMDCKKLFNAADSALYKAKNAGRNCLRSA